MGMMSGDPATDREILRGAAIDFVCSLVLMSGLAYIVGCCV